MVNLTNKRHLVIILSVFLLIIGKVFDTLEEEISIILYPKPITKTFELRVSYYKYIDAPYKYGGTSLKRGIDCSALTQLLYKEIHNYNLPRTSKTQSLYNNKQIHKDSLIVGDLLFFGINNNVSHVAYYINNNKIIHATSRGVIIDSIGNSVWKSYWELRYIGALRVL